MGFDRHSTIRCYESTRARIAAAAKELRLSQADVIRLAFDQAGTAKVLEREAKRLAGVN